MEKSPSPEDEPQMHSATPEDLGPSGEAIERLENANLPVSDKIEILLVELGEKPATLRTYYSSIWKDGEEPQPILENGFNELMAATENAGLLIDVDPDKVEVPDEHLFSGPAGAKNREWLEGRGRKVEINESQRRAIRVVYIAKTPENLGLMKEAYRQNDDVLYGRAYGFPETATAAFMENRGARRTDELPDADPAALAFAQYIFSPEHAEEELETGRRWAEAVRAASPKLYQDRLDEYLGKK